MRCPVVQVADPPARPAPLAIPPGGAAVSPLGNTAPAAPARSVQQGGILGRVLSRTSSLQQQQGLPVSPADPEAGGGSFASSQASVPRGGAGAAGSHGQGAGRAQDQGPTAQSLPSLFRQVEIVLILQARIRALSLPNCPVHMIRLLPPPPQGAAVRLEESVPVVQQPARAQTLAPIPTGPYAATGPLQQPPSMFQPTVPQPPPPSAAGGQAHVAAPPPQPFPEALLQQTQGGTWGPLQPHAPAFVPAELGRLSVGQVDVRINLSRLLGVGMSVSIHQVSYHEANQGPAGEVLADIGVSLPPLTTPPLAPAQGSSGASYWACCPAPRATGRCTSLCSGPLRGPTRPHTSRRRSDALPSATPPAVLPGPSRSFPPRLPRGPKCRSSRSSSRKRRGSARLLPLSWDRPTWASPWIWCGWPPSPTQGPPLPDWQSRCSRCPDRSASGQRRQRTRGHRPRPWGCSPRPSGRAGRRPQPPAASRESRGASHWPPLTSARPRGTGRGPPCCRLPGRCCRPRPPPGHSRWRLRPGGARCPQEAGLFAQCLRGLTASDPPYPGCRWRRWQRAGTGPPAELWRRGRRRPPRGPAAGPAGRLVHHVAGVDWARGPIRGVRVQPHLPLLSAATACGPHAHKPAPRGRLLGPGGEGPVHFLHPDRQCRQARSDCGPGGRPAGGPWRLPGGRGRRLPAAGPRCEPLAEEADC